jgi:hypothetical protein
LAPSTQLSLFPELTPNELVAAAIKGTRDTSGVSRLVRTSGSYIDQLTSDTDGERTVKFLSLCVFEDITAKAKKNGWAVPQCSYYQAQIIDVFNGYLNAVTLNDLAVKVCEYTIDEWDQLPGGEERNSIGKRLNGLLADIGPMVMGDHEPMFKLDYFPHPVNHITLITGPDQGQTVVYTWFPGDPVGKPARLGDVAIHGSISL